MKILIFSTVFYPSIGGIENQTLLLIKNFVEKGHEVKVITYQKQNEPFEHFEVYYRPGIIKSIKLFLWCTSYYMPNISLKGVWLLLFNPTKTWVISHNDFSSCNKKGIINILKNLANRFATKNIAVSKSIASHISHSVAVVRNCYDESIFKINNKEVRDFDFVFLGRLVSQKGVDLLIRACSELKQPFSLIIIGGGPEKESLLTLTNDLALNGNITFTGILTGEKLANTLNRCKIMIVPSLHNEGFGMVVLEGLACGCKIIAANAGGLTEAVGGYGVNFEMGDQERLTKLLENAISGEETGQSDNVALNDYLKKHSSSAVANAYLQYFT